MIRARRNRRHVPTTAELAAREFVRAWGLFRDAMAPYFARFGLHSAHWGVLRSLHSAEHDGEAPIRLSDLGRRLLVRPPSITTVVARLERMGLLTRRTSDVDQRAKWVALTRQGRTLVETILRHHAAQMRSVLGGMDARETREFLELLRRMNRHLERARGARESTQEHVA